MEFVIKEKSIFEIMEKNNEFKTSWTSLEQYGLPAILNSLFGEKIGLKIRIEPFEFDGYITAQLSDKFQYEDEVGNEFLAQFVSIHKNGDIVLTGEHPNVCIISNENISIA